MNTSGSSDTKLEYARPGAECPVSTRIVVEHSSTGVRYIDPPGSGMMFYQITAICAVSMAVIAVVVALARGRTVAGTLFPLVTAGIFVWGAIEAMKHARGFATRPTIIEVGRDGLRLTHPGSGFHHWNHSEVKIFVAKPLLLKSRWLNWLVITAEGQRYMMLQSRPLAELEWLAAQLRQALEDMARASPVLATQIKS